MSIPSRVRVLFTVGVLAGSLALVGCPKRPEVGEARPGAVSPSASTVPALPEPQPAPRPPEISVTRPAPPAETQVQSRPQAATTPAGSPLKDIFFDFDEALIREDQKKALDEDFAWLKAHSEVKVTIAGHCDERGTAEYNLGLGERRAKVVKDHLVAEGIAADRITTISYGSEHAFVLGHDELAWKWNRRDHFVMTQQGELTSSR